MGRAQRDKGSSGEREVSKAIYDGLGVRLVRNLNQSRCGGYDLTLAPDQTGPVAEALSRLAIEIKRHAKVTPANIRTWWRQSESQAETAGLVPALAYRPDRGAWRFVLPLHAVRSDLTRAPGIEFTADLSLEGFCAVIREATP